MLACLPTTGLRRAVHACSLPFAELRPPLWSGRPGSLLTLAPHRSGRAGSAASGSSTDSFATRRRVPAGPGSQAMATAIPKACLASSAIRCRDVETGPNLGVLAVFPSNGATCRCPLPSTARWCTARDSPATVPRSRLVTDECCTTATCQAPSSDLERCTRRGPRPLVRPVPGLSGHLQ